MRSSLRAGWRGLRLAEHVLTGFLLTLALAAQGQGARRSTPAGVVQWWHRRLCRILGVRIHVDGPVPVAPGLFVANHVSWLDIPILGALGPMDFVSKSEVRGWPLIGWLADRAGTLFIHRGSGELRDLDQAMQERLTGRESILLFPEGTTTDGSDVRPFFPRLFRCALTCGGRITPVALRYTCGGELSRSAPFIGDDRFPAHLRRMLRQARTDVFVRYCPPVAVAVEGEPRRRVSQRTHEAIRSALRDLGLPKRPAPAPIQARESSPGFEHRESWT